MRELPRDRQVARAVIHSRAMKSYRAWSPTQSFLLPPSPLEWLPEGHLAYFVLEVTQALDLSAIEDAIQEDDASVDPAERRRAATRAAKAEEKARELTGKDDGDGPGGGAPSELPHHRVPAEVDGAPKPQAQRNFTDPDSRIMVKGGEVLQGYNAQAAVDAECQVIVAAAVTNQPPDQEHLPPMLAQVIANCTDAPAVATADNGYLSCENLAACAAHGVDAYIATGRDPAKAPLPTETPTPARQARAAMSAKLATAEGKALYARRKVIVEPVFGQIKQARGFRRFSFRGLAAVRAEWSFVCATHNLLKLFRHGAWPALAASAPG